MNVSELQPKQGKVDLILDIVEKGELREFQKFGKGGKVCNATGKDDSGQISLTLWNEQVEQVNLGDKVKITNGYVGEWHGEKQLSTGKFGTLEVVGKAGSASVSNPSEKTAPKPEQTVSSSELDDSIEDDDDELDIEEENFS